MIRIAINATYYDFTGLTTPLNVWRHCAIVRSGTTVKLYRDGIDVGNSKTISTDITEPSGESIIGGAYFGPGAGTLYSNSGYLSNLRVIKGTALYTSNFTPPAAPVNAITNTSLLLNFTNAGIFDATGKNNLETVGNAQISTSVKKYGTGSLAFDGTGDYLVGPERENFNFGNGNFTIEMWFYVVSFPNTYIALYDARPASTNGFYPVISVQNNGTAYFFINSGNAISSSSGAVSTGQWYHLAVAKNGSSTKMFINGLQVGSTYTDTNTYLNPANRPIIGAAGFSLGVDSLNGYIDDLRITKGIARYTAAFTPPTSAHILR
jgi:hypothetical protein